MPVRTGPREDLPQVIKDRVQQALLSATLAKKYEVRTGYQIDKLFISLCNTHATNNHQVDVHIVDNTVTATADITSIIAQSAKTKLHPGETQVYELCEYVKPGGEIWAVADTADVVTLGLNIRLERID